MSRREDRDRMELSPPPPIAPRGPATPAAVLPAEEPGPASVAQQMASIRRRIGELEDTFRYMGSGHPHFEATRTHIAMLRRMLQQVEAVLGPTPHTEC